MMGGRGHFSPNRETLAGDNGGGEGTFWPEMISSPEIIKAGVMPVDYLKNNIVFHGFVALKYF